MCPNSIFYVLILQRRSIERMLTVQPPGNHQLDDVWSDCPATQNYGSTGYGSITRDDLLFLKPSLGGGFKYSLFSTPNAGEMIQFEWVAQKNNYIDPF